VKVVITGAHGFVGWHLRCRFKATTDHSVVPVARNELTSLTELIEGADAIVHLAAVNRGNDEELTSGNTGLAQAVVEAVRATNASPRIVHANSIQTGNGTPYGTSKARVSDAFADLAEQQGLDFVDVVLPNLFGEHGRPDHNSFVATFCRDVLTGREPEVRDADVELLHVQDAAQWLINGLDGPSRVDRPRGELHGVREVLDLIEAFESTYRNGEIPALTTAFEIDLFNTLRTAMFEEHGPIHFEKRSDVRGTLVEAVKAHGGGGQTFFSTTVPEATRGDHFHLRKIERFLVIAGQARVRLRKLFTAEVVSFDVSGDDPVGIDMPTMWAHNITNTGDSELLTLFWADSVFDPGHPDTYPEPVAIGGTEIEVTT
jgi:UDP-2-acetamido-2,6-beta-L-arabino-hexul-4-ose reductase